MTKQKIQLSKRADRLIASVADIAYSAGEWRPDGSYPGSFQQKLDQSHAAQDALRHYVADLERIFNHCVDEFSCGWDTIHGNDEIDGGGTFGEAIDRILAGGAK